MRWIASILLLFMAPAVLAASVPSGTSGARRFAAFNADGTTGTLLDPNYIYWEGATHDAIRTILGVTDPTTSRTLWLPDRGGTLATVDQIATAMAALDSIGTLTVAGRIATTTQTPPNGATPVAPVAVNQTLTAINAHAYEDNSLLSTTDTGLGYASFDAYPKMTTTQNEDHFVAFQARPRYYGDNVLSRFDAFHSSLEHWGVGNVWNAVGLNISDVAGTGPISNNYGIFINDMTRGTANYAIYSAGGQNYFAGNTGFGTATTPQVKVDVVGSTASRGIARIALSQGTVTTAPTAVSAANYLQIGGQECGASSYRLIGFGFNNGGTSVPPAAIGYLENSILSGYTKGSIVLMTRGTTTATDPPIARLTADFDGNVVINTGQIIVPTAKTPASATAAGIKGTVCWDADYVYVCVDTNVWKRTAISTW